MSTVYPTFLSRVQFTVFLSSVHSLLSFSLVVCSLQLFCSSVQFTQLCSEVHSLSHFSLVVSTVFTQLFSVECSLQPFSSCVHSLLSFSLVVRSLSHLSVVVSTVFSEFTKSLHSRCLEKGRRHSTDPRVSSTKNKLRVSFLGPFSPSSLYLCNQHLNTFSSTSISKL